MFVWKDKNKRKGGRGWPIFLKKDSALADSDTLKYYFSVTGRTWATLTGSSRRRRPTWRRRTSSSWWTSIRTSLPDSPSSIRNSFSTSEQEPDKIRIVWTTPWKIFVVVKMFHPFARIFYLKAGWPDLAKFRLFGWMLTVYFLFADPTLVNLWHHGLIFIVANGQILKNNTTIWSHCLKGATDTHHMIDSWSLSRVGIC